MHGHIESGWALRGNKFNEVTNLVVGHKHTLSSNETRSARRQVKHITLAEQTVGAVFVENHSTVDLRCNLECNPARNVRFDHAGNDICSRRLRGYDQMNTRSACHLSYARNRGLDIGWRRLHQIGQFIDNDDDVGNLVRNLQLCSGSFIGCVRRFCRRHACLHRIFPKIDILLFRRATIKAIDVAHANASEELIAPFHLINQPAQGEQHFFRIGHDWEREMRQRIVKLHLHYLGIDYDEAQFLRRKSEEHAGNECVDAHTLATAGGASHKQMRHLRQIRHDCFAINVFTECKRNFCMPFRFPPVGRLQEFAQCHRHFASVRELNSHSVFAGNGRKNVDSLSACRAREIALQAHDFVNPDTFGRIYFITRDRGAFGDVARRHRNAELRQCINQSLLDLLQFRRVCAAPPFRVVLVEQIKSRQHVSFRVPSSTS